MKLLERLILILFLAFFISGCSRQRQPEIVNAKVIEYKVEYVDEVAGSIPTSILPAKMTLIFAEKMAMNTIDGFLGQFTLTYIADLKKETVVTMLKLFDKKYFHKGESGESPAGIATMDGMKLEETGSTSRILEFDARKFILHIPGYEEKEIWSTSDIQIKNPNITTPYKELEDVLLQFYTELSVLKMNMMAQNFEEKTLSNEIFMVPEKYEEISRTKMEKILDELFK